MSECECVVFRSIKRKENGEERERKSVEMIFSSSTNDRHKRSITVEHNFPPCSNYTDTTKENVSNSQEHDLNVKNRIECECEWNRIETESHTAYVSYAFNVSFIVQKSRKNRDCHSSIYIQYTKCLCGTLY